MIHPERWLVFDLGGVLFDFNGAAGVSALTQLPAEDAHQLLVCSTAVRDLETGRIGPNTFARQFAAELGLDLSDDAMLALWASWEAGPKPGALALLKRLRGKARLACLTNNNQIHWERLTTRHAVDTLFDRCFLSHEIRLHKPDPRIFEHLVAQLGLRPSEVIYFDDRQDIVTSARRFGLDAYRVTAPKEIEAVLSDL